MGWGVADTEVVPTMYLVMSAPYYRDGTTTDIRLEKFIHYVTADYVPEEPEPIGNITINGVVCLELVQLHSDGAIARVYYLNDGYVKLVEYMAIDEEWNISVNINDTGYTVVSYFTT